MTAFEFGGFEEGAAEAHDDRAFHLGPRAFGVEHQPAIERRTDAVHRDLLALDCYANALGGSPQPYLVPVRPRSKRR